MKDNKQTIFEGLPCNSINYQEFGVPKEIYKNIFSDEKVTDDERIYLYKTYYKPSPNIFKSHATHYGSDLASISEILQYGSWMRQQMERGWVLIASGQYGYHPLLKNNLYVFINKYYGELGEKDPNDILLSKQKSSLYFYFADGGINRINRDKYNQPIPVLYNELNDNQKRVYNITNTQPYKMKKLYFTTIEEQSETSEQKALDSGKYIGVVSAKSINDFGRRFMLYKCIGKKLDFVGVVLVGGESKRDDWTGLGSPTNSNFSFNHFPLSIRECNNLHWGFDFPTSIYKYFGGIDGATEEIIAIDPDKQTLYNQKERVR